MRFFILIGLIFSAVACSTPNPKVEAQPLRATAAESEAEPESAVALPGGAFVFCSTPQMNLFLNQSVQAFMKKWEAGYHKGSSLYVVLGHNKADGSIDLNAKYLVNSSGYKGYAEKIATIQASAGCSFSGFKED